jgi:hypothetical protein
MGIGDIKYLILFTLQVKETAETNRKSSIGHDANDEGEGEERATGTAGQPTHWRELDVHALKVF